MPRCPALSGGGFDRMVRRQTSAGEVTLFFHDQGTSRIAVETDGAGTVKTRYILDGQGEVIANETTGTGGRGWYIEDTRGNLAQLVDNAGAVKGVFAYDPFGKEKPALTSKAAGWDSRLRFQMAPRDPKTGMYSLGARLLDPAINRFVGADHYVAAAANIELALDPLTGNRYLYAGANPASLIDDGHAPKRKCGRWDFGCKAKKLGAAAAAAGKLAWKHRDQIAFGLAVVGTFACALCTAAFYAGMAVTAASTVNSCAQRDRGGCAGGVLSLATGGAGRFFQASGRTTILAGRAQMARRGLSNTLVRLEGRVLAASGRVEWGIGTLFGGISTSTSGYCANSSTC